MPSPEYILIQVISSNLSLTDIPEEKSRPESPGPGQYTCNFGAIQTTQPFDDIFRLLNESFDL